MRKGVKMFMVKINEINVVHFDMRVLKKLLYESARHDYRKSDITV
jgi:hypothetical protein